MKSMKNLVFTITMLVSAQAFAMEAPPAAPSQGETPVKAAQVKPLMPIKIFPPDIQRTLFPLCMEGNLYEIAETVLALAGTNKEHQAYINANMITILESFSHTAKAIEVYKLLQNKRMSLPIMQTLSMKKWLEDAQNSLCDGEALFDALCDYRSIEKTHKLLKIKNLNLNRAHHGRDFTCLGQAVCYAFSMNKVGEEKVALLLKAGANPNLADAGGGTPLLWSIHSKNKDIVVLLLEAGADPDLKNPKNGNKTARDKALEKELIEIVALLDQASLQKKQKSEERRKKLYEKIELKNSKTADGCTIS